MQISQRSKRITIVDLRYPYGKDKVYLSGSLCSVGARLLALGHEVKAVDFNMDRFDDPSVQSTLRESDIIGVSMIGAPYIPSSIEFARKTTRLAPHAPIMFGGQVIECLSPNHFSRLFSGTNSIQIKDDQDLARLIGRDPVELARIGAYNTSYVPFYKTLGDKRLKHYLSHEMTLVLGQGCAFECLYCAARKGQRETFANLDVFEENLRFLAESAKRFGIPQIEFYASSLDFFQNPTTVAEHLKVLAYVQRDTGIKIKTRCLSCLTSFLSANRRIPNLGQLVNDAGLWCIGFGVEGTDEEIWKAQKKTHNRVGDISEAFNLCRDFGMRTELLWMVGFHDDTPKTLWKRFINAIKFALTWPNVVVRVYLTKEFIPGNHGWQSGKYKHEVEKVISNPELFFNLDVTACGTKLTHPRLIHRWVSNVTYLGIACLLSPFGKQATGPIFPQSGNRLKRFIAKTLNRLMPTER